MRSRLGKRIAAGFSLALAASLLVVVPSLANARNPAPASSPIGARTPRPGTAPLAPSDPDVFLCASMGSATMPDAQVLDIWGFSLDTNEDAEGGCDPATLPGPQLVVDEGDLVNVHLTNADVPTSVSVVVPGLSPALDTEGVDAGESDTYTFTASAPGTYLYETGAGDQRGVLMGLYGALVVQSATAGQAYDTDASAFDAEAVLVLSELDAELTLDPLGFDLLDYAPEYWLINGTAHPDASLDPIVEAGASDRVLLRYLNAGSLHHTMTLLGAHQRVIAKDAYPTSFPFDVVAETIPAGATLDTIATLPAASPVGKRFPLYSRQLHLTNDGDFPGGMLAFIEVNAAAVNEAPDVDAGSDQTITLPASANLNGTVDDDGLPDPPGTLTTTWTNETPLTGTVTFGNANAVDTTASFSAPGLYVLRLAADDSLLATFDDVMVTVNPEPSMHVGDLDGTAVSVNANNWRATALVAVHDASHAPLSGATVTGTWTPSGGGGSAITTCTTNGGGTCTVQSGTQSKASVASAVFTVTSVTHATLPYHSSDNHDPDGSSDGTSVTVSRPPMHVGDIDGSGVNQSNGTQWTATVTITVHDASHVPISGATVFGTWSAGSGNPNVSCTTNGSGQCTLSRVNLSRTTVLSITFTITNVTNGTGVYRYVSADNHDPDGDSTGTVIVALRP